MPKYGAKVDDNQKQIVAALEKIGCTVLTIGKPVDLLVGLRSRNFLIEVKNPNSSGYKGTKEQRDFIRDWPGQVQVLWTAEQAIKLVTGAYGGSR